MKSQEKTNAKCYKAHAVDTGRGKRSTGSVVFTIVRTNAKNNNEQRTMGHQYLLGSEPM